jgi:hypothetical protein
MAISRAQVEQIRASYGYANTGGEAQWVDKWSSGTGTAQELKTALAARITREGPPIGASAPPAPQTNRAESNARAQSLNPWLSGSLLGVYSDAYVEYGDSALALQEVRNGAGKAEYDQVFQGNRRTDGTLRMSENDYFSQVASYKATLEQRGINSNLFQGKFGEMIGSDVSANEFEGRVQAVNEGIGMQSENIRRAFSDASGIADFSQEAVLASVLDPDGVGRELLDRKIGISQVRGTAADFGFTLGGDRADLLAARGLGLQGSQDFFGEAQGVTRSLSSIARRFDRDDQTVGIDETTDALLLGDQTQSDRFGRLLSREGSSFSSQSDGVRRSRDGGGLSGLSTRR